MIQHLYEMRPDEVYTRTFFSTMILEIYKLTVYCIELYLLLL